MNAAVRGMRRCALGIVLIRCAAADEKTDVAATILRMLYIKDLRGLQTLIDETLVNVQNYTANPKTDAALGRIGR
ncbi:hypothetical protein ABBQ32_013544 [Trebouxia sp. C0010 RCD-2024]